MPRQLVVRVGAGLVATLLMAGVAAASTTTTTRVTADGEADWHFNRDPNNVAPYDFSFEEASIGYGSLHAGPIASAGPSKFIAELFDVDTHLTSMPVAGLRSVSYDFMIENGTANQAKQFYLNLYVNVPGSDSFYDCRYDYVPAPTPTGQWTTVTFSASARSLARTRGANGPLCTLAIADMPAGSKVTFLSLNIGDTGVGDVGVSGYFDNVGVSTDAATTVYDFEVPLSDKDDCKDGGFVRYGFSNQGPCVAAVQANPRSHT